MTAKFNADFCAQQIQFINEELAVLWQEIVPGRKTALWTGTEEEREAISPYWGSSLSVRID
jgi:hypothetical protein